MHAPGEKVGSETAGFKVGLEIGPSTYLEASRWAWRLALPHSYRLESGLGHWPCYLEPKRL